MVFAVLLAGGVGSRMGNIEKPKQYLNIGGRPIIVHTIEKFFLNDKFEKIYVLCPEEWISHTKNLVRKYLGPIADDRLEVIQGGETRNETIMNAIKKIEEEYEVDDDTVLVSYNLPFISQKVKIEMKNF